MITAFGLCMSTPLLMAYHVVAWYIRPVSRNLNPIWEATDLPTDDLPEPAGPSIAIIPTDNARGLEISALDKGPPFVP
jgi:hypothetical protein